jgi:hypothetical protein
VKAFNRFWIWFGVPAILGGAAYMQSADLARVAAVLMWAVLLAVGFTTTVAMTAVLLMKPTDDCWQESKAAWFKDRPGAFAKAISWSSLLITVVLAAFTGFAVTAGAYLLTSLWTRLAVSLIYSHFDKNDAGVAGK